MSGRVRVTIGRVTVDGGTIADPALLRAEVERQVALSLAAPDAHAVAGAIAAAIGGGRPK